VSSPVSLSITSVPASTHFPEPGRPTKNVIVFGHIPIVCAVIDGHGNGIPVFPDFMSRYRCQTTSPSDGIDTADDRRVLLDVLHDLVYLHDL
jgi:hypothetical protein